MSGDNKKNNINEILYKRQNAGMYIHIPFCRSKCNYCDFYSLPCIGRSGDFMNEYINGLRNYIEYFSEKYSDLKFDSIYFGGGTPSIFGTKLADILKITKNRFNILPESEITLEANPESMNYEELAELRETGFNRISIGMQSSSDDMLKKLGRVHDRQMFERAYNDSKRAGFDNISVDMMYALPGETLCGVVSDCKYICSLLPQHISAYALKVEDNTPFAKRDIISSLPDEDTQYEMYENIINILREHGYNQYEISNFALKNNYSKHNMKYWTGADYLGIGPAAYSKIGDVRFHIKSDIKAFGNDINGNIIIDEKLTDEAVIEEYIMLMLRTADGIDMGVIKNVIAVQCYEKMVNKINIYLQAGFMKKTNQKYSLTSRGEWLSNEIISEILCCIE